jgi:hypothetical protein
MRIRKALRMRMPRTAVSADASHLFLFGNNMRKRLTQETRLCVVLGESDSVSQKLNGS